MKLKAKFRRVRYGKISPAWITDFKSNIDTSGGEDACHPWKGYVGTNSLPHTVAFGNREHHWNCRPLVYYLTTGKQVGRKAIYTTCDNPLCLNPKHFLVGHMSPKAYERVFGKKPHVERVLRGEGHPNAKLTAEKVRAIRKYHREHPDQSYAQVGKVFDVSSRHTFNIVKRKQWAHVTDEPDTSDIPEATEAWFQKATLVGGHGGD